MAEQQTEQQLGADFRTGEEENVDQLVLYEKVDKHIALITLNRPERLGPVPLYAAPIPGMLAPGERSCTSRTSTTAAPA